MIKSLKDISWICEEEEYRADEAVSYSQLSYFMREGFRALPKMNDRVETEALRYGSLLDCIMTDNENLENRFYISSINRPSDAISRMIEALYLKHGESTGRLVDIPQESLIIALDDESYYTNYGTAKRIEYLYKYGAEYYQMIKDSNGKTIVSNEDFRLAKNSAYILKTHEFTAPYFNYNPFKTEVEKLFQLKFKMPYKGKYVRCMKDLIVVDHESKEIIPCDLKTTSYNEEEFNNSFKKWLYYIQGQLYTHILKWNISQDEYFKDFNIKPYKFIVINKFNNNPLVWEFKDSLHVGDYIDSDGFELKGWESIYDEMIYYLDNNQFKYPKEAMLNNGIIQIKDVFPAERGKKKVVRLKN